MKSILFILILSVLSLNIKAQEAKDDSSSAKLSDIISPSIVNISGEAGFSGELYSISGRDARRPGVSGRVFIRPTLTLFNNFSVNFDIFLSTEGSSARQQINQIALHPEWSWGRAHLGDFSHEFSKFTLSGVTIRGGGLEIYPGIFRLQIVGGQTQRAVEEGPYSSAYSRYLAGVKVGIGSPESFLFDINVIRVRDNTASLPKDLFIKDSAANTGTSQYGVTPQENMVAGINTQFSLFDRMFKFNGEVAASVFTRDMYSSTFTNEDLKEADLPTFINDIYKLRLSTNADFAYLTELSFNYDIVSAKVSYSVINPGYTSLGIGSLINDKRNIAFSSGIRLFNNNLSLQVNYQLQNDNLLKQKLYTLSRATYGLSMNVRPIKELAFVFNTVQNNMNNDATNDTLKISNITSIYSANVLSQLDLFNLSHSITGNYSLQIAENQNILRKGEAVTVNNLGLGFQTRISPNWSAGPNISFNIVNIPDREKAVSSTYNFRVINKMLNSKLSNSLIFGYTDAGTIRSSIITLQSGFSLSSSDMFTFSIRSAFYTTKNGTTTGYQEHKANLAFNHRF